MARIIPTIDLTGKGDLTCRASTTSFDSTSPPGGVVKEVAVHLANWGYITMSRKETIKLMKELGKLLNLEVKNAT